MQGQIDPASMSAMDVIEAPSDFFLACPSTTGRLKNERPLFSSGRQLLKNIARLLS
jgi:hypothetical protein